MGEFRKPSYPNPEAVVYPKSIPYIGHIPGGIHDGKLIEIRGSVPYGADSFGVNLCTGPDFSCDRALHLSVRFHGHMVVRNSREQNEWCEEERGGVFPFSSGRDFTLMILVETLCYKIAVNSQHCWEFYHRIPMDRVSSLLIEGSINVERIEFIDRLSPYQPGYPTGICPGVQPGYVPYPGVCDPPTPYYPGNQVDPGFYPSGVCDPPTPYYPGNQVDPGFYPGVCNPPPVYPSGRISPGYVPGINPSNPTSYPGTGTCIIPPPEQHITPGYVPRNDLAPVYNPPIPYAYPIYGGIKPGMMIYLSGRPSASAYNFVINLQSGTAPYPPPDITFHLSVRFYNQTVVRNSRINDCWENEETMVPFFPFQQGVNFDMVIRVDIDKFMVAIDGRHFFEFRHRLMPLERFDTLYIENDIVVSSIRFT